MKKFSKRILAMMTVAAMVCTTVLSNVGSMNKVEAASTYEAENLLVNPDFEENTAFGGASDSRLGNWCVWQNVTKTQTGAQNGNTAAVIAGQSGGSSLEQDVAGSELQVGQTYIFTVYAKTSNPGYTGDMQIGVKNYGGAQLTRQVTSSDWGKYEVEFTYLSGNPRVFGWTDSSNASDQLYMDNASLTVKSDIQNASIQNGQLDVTFVNSYTGAPSASDFSATYTSSADADNVQALALTQKSVGEKTISLSFEEIAALAVDQIVTVNLTYNGQVITLDFTVEASGAEVVTANIASVEAENGTVSVVLDADPTVTPTAADFTWRYTVNDGEEKTLSVKDFAYDKATKTATVVFDQMRGLPSGEQNVAVTVTYNGQSAADTFVVPVGTSCTYYVSNSGNDNNDGLTPATAFATIDKLNTITFLPGDQILFENGSTFVGSFKPQGSGAEGNPIVIGTYGDADARPVLQPGADWTVDYIMSANAMVRNAKVNYVIQFYNVEYWEVSGLEIMDPNSEAYLTQGSGKWIGNSANDVYRSGITVQGEDIGTLEHIYIDNVIIHGFHGPGTNIGKTSGGITMNVITNGDRNRQLSVPTQINDIRITNCEIYDVGRSGINFLTPWSFRTDEKWGPFNYGTRGYEYLPYEDFYMANNYIHDVDGDGTIIDNCSNAICESNLVTRCCLRPATTGGGAAVGLFNWNSDDVYFQFNEVYDTRPGANPSSQSNDNQGIEIDALNDRTWVQYNYVHDNYGGFMMLCNVGDSYRSFDGIVRYNISQNDYAHTRQGLFDIYAANYGTEIYNNTFYLTERALSENGYLSNDVQVARPGEIFLFSAAGTGDMMKFYNNIFYYDGETPAAANTFGDGAIDWQSNIFYGFTNMPADDNPGMPNMNVDPKLVNIGNGGTGAYPGEKVDLSCYYTTEGSPAINAGVPIDDGGRDYFGNKVTGIPDIGAYESGSVVLKVMSRLYAFDQEEKTATVIGKVTADEFIDSLIVEDGVSVQVKRGSATLTGGVRIAAGDVVTATYNGETITYTVELEEAEISSEVPLADMTATAGSEESSQASDLASNAIDGNLGTMWHTAWNGCPAADRYLTIELANDYELTGYVYTPRTSQSNGIITKYQILVSDDNSTWETAAEGTWANNNTVKTVMFENAVQAKYVKLLAVESVANFASAAEVRLLGTRVYSDTTAPAAPVVTAGNITETTATISWPAPAEDDVVEYVLKNGAEVIATFAPGATSYTLADLEEDTEYTFNVYAVDEAGNMSAAGVVTFKTLSGNTEEPECEHKNTEIRGAVAATCETPGQTGDKVCTECGLTLENSTQIPALGHKMGEWKVVKEATEEAEGLEERTCTREGCTYKEQRSIPKLPSKPADPEPAKPEEINKEALDKYYEECLAYYKEAGYTANSWKAYETAVANAKAVLAKDDATEEEIKDAIEALAAATEQLAKAPETKPEDPNQDKKPTDSKDENKAPVTGDNLIVMPIMIMMFAAVAVIAEVVFVRKNRR